MTFSATPRFKYRDYWGFEINILVELARVLNFTYTIENPPDGMCCFNYCINFNSIMYFAKN